VSHPHHGSLHSQDGDVEYGEEDAPAPSKGGRGVPTLSAPPSKKGVKAGVAEVEKREVRVRVERFSGYKGRYSAHGP